MKKISAIEFGMQFFDDVDEFLERRPNGLVALHGPDSINRPGYLIARYLIEKYSWDADAAIKVLSQVIVSTHKR